ncbi:MAG: rhomboid family intramembrane serine protease [Pirellulales bacterium]|nr:rhomboid family intramembrane serine protease [Pirellulales bacterium]
MRDPSSEAADNQVFHESEAVIAFARTLSTLTPWRIVTPTLVIANVVVFVVMVASGVDAFRPVPRSLADWGANFGPMTMNGQWWRLGTCMFLHAGIVHLALNMLFLWYVGRLVERLVENFGFVVLYFVSGIAGSIASLAWHPERMSVGASGAIFGVTGGLLGFILLRRDSMPDAVFRQLRHSVLGLIVYNVLFGAAVPGIDTAAHIGGLAAGFVGGLVLSQPLSAEKAPRRWLRNAALLIIGTAGLLAAAVALPDAPRDIEQELRRFGDLEREAVKISRALVPRLQQGQVSEEEFAETLERRVIRPWIETRRTIEGLLDKPNFDRAFLARLVEYMKLREEGWQLQADGVRSQDARKIELGVEKQEAADKLARELSAR